MEGLGRSGQFFARTDFVRPTRRLVGCGPHEIPYAKRNYEFWIVPAALVVPIIVTDRQHGRVIGMSHLFLSLMCFPVFW